MGLGRTTAWLAGAWVLLICICTTASWGQEERRVGPGPAPLPERKAPAGDADFPPLKIIELDVVDSATNKPVAGVKLTARVSNQARTWTTGEDGHARLDVDGDARSLQVAASADGFVPVTVAWSAGRPGEAIPGEYLLKLERGTALGGRVTDEAGRAVAGADVMLSIQRKGERARASFFDVGGGGGNDDAGGGGGVGRASLSSVAVKTDPDGRWRFDLAPAQIESLRVRVVHPDYLSDETFGVRPPPEEAKLRDQTSVMVVWPGVTVAGRVVDPEGRPVGGAAVSMAGARFGAKLPAGRSGADGAFALAHVRPGQRATLVVKAKGWAPALTQVQVDKDATDANDVAVTLEPAKTLHVRVVDPKGQPIGGATVSTGTWRGVNELAWRGTTDADGRVAWTEAPPDGVGLGAAARGYVSSIDRSVVAGEEEHVITLTPMTRIAGTVVDDASGKPVERFRAAVASPARPGTISITLPAELGNVTYGGGGTFDLVQNRGRSPYTVQVEARGYVPATSREIKPGEEDVKLEFRLKKGRDVAATLRLPDGAPVDGADVILVGDSGQAIIRNGKVSPQTFAPRTRSDPAGRFRFDPQAGAYTVIVLHDRGFAEVPAERFAGAEDPTIEVGPWATIRGTARVGSKPAAGQTVTAMDQSGRRWARARIDCSAAADEQGQFVLDRVPPGTIMVGIEARSEEAQGTQRVTRIAWTQQRYVEAEAGKTTEVKLGGAGRAVVGRLIAPAAIGDKAEWKHATVRLTTRTPSKRQLPPDWATLTPEARQKLDEAWFSSPDGRAETKLQVGRFRNYPARVSPTDGTFRVDDVEPGNYYVTAQLMKANAAADGARAVALQTWAFARREVTVAAGKPDDAAVDVGKIELSTSDETPNPIRRPPTRVPAE